MTTATMKGARRIRPFLKYPGGKYRLASEIIRRFPYTDRFVDLTVGGGSVPLAMPGGVQVSINDLCSDLINAWLQLRDRPADVIAALQAIPYEESSWKQSLIQVESDDPLEAAVGYIVRSRMSLSGLGTAFSRSSRLRRGKPEGVSAWETYRDSVLPEIADRIASFEIFNRDLFELIEALDDPDVLFYVDPPYLLETRVSGDLYRLEVTDQDASRSERLQRDRLWHARLLEVLNGVQGKVALSGYPSDLYGSMLGGDWFRHEFDMPSDISRSKEKQRRTECLWVRF